MLTTIPLNQLRPVTSLMQGDGYEFKHLRPKNWLLRATGNMAVRVLKSIGWLTRKTYEHVTMETVTFDADRFVEYFHRQLNELRIRGVENGVVIIGAKQFSDVTRSFLTQHPFSFKLDSYRYGPEVVGMKIIVLPWVDGVAIVPENRIPMKEIIRERELSEYPTIDLLKAVEKRDGKAAAFLWNEMMGRNDG